MAIKFFSRLFRDPAYDHRKLLNSEDLIQTLNKMGYKHAEIAEICGVSKTMISHWGNPNRSEKPAFRQVEPILEMCGKGRFECELEPLPSSAVEHIKIKGYLAVSVLALALGSIVWFSMVKPCFDRWSECKELEWHQMGAFQLTETMESIGQWKEWKKSQGENFPP